MVAPAPGVGVLKFKESRMQNGPAWQNFIRSTAMAAIAVGLVLSPAMAKSGNGNGSGNGNAGGKNTANAADKSNPASGIPANDLGALNGFFHASPKALAKASPKSEIGKVEAYGNLLASFLTPTAGTTPPTLAQLAAALQLAANKPLSVAIIEAVDTKLAATNPSLATSISTYSGGATGSGNSDLRSDLSVGDNIAQVIGHPARRPGIGHMRWRIE
ncbi:hypothetical protein ACVOMV_18575 [Mesorhizobium atlanticum]